MVSCATGLTDFNQLGTRLSLVLQNGHFTKQEFSNDLSQKFLSTYLRTVDPSKIFFTQKDVDKLEKKYGKELGFYLLGNQTLSASRDLFDTYASRVEDRVGYALKLLSDKEFTFDKDKYIARSRRKLDWVKDEKELDSLWDDLIEEQLLSEMLRRETIASMAKEQGKPDPSANEKPPKEKLKLRYERVLRNLKESSDDADKVNLLLSTVCRSYDPHTDYMGASESKRFFDGMSRSMIGIGALLGEEDDGAIKINGIVVGGPADKSGELKLNDRIVGVDTDNSGEMTDILFMRLDKVVELIRGKENTEVRLKVEPATDPGQVKIVSLTRKKVEMKDELAKAEIIELKNEQGKPIRLGLLNLPSFYGDMAVGKRKSGDDVKAILQRMNEEKVEGLVIDLRGNGGGYLEEARKIVSYFIGTGPVVQSRDAKGDVNVELADARTPLFKGEVVVLIDKTSASASEIVAAALQDYGRAVIIGDTSSFGKGTVQRPVDLGPFLPYFSDQSQVGSLKITTQKYYRVNGGSTQLKGVESDIVLPTVTAAYDIGESTMDNPMPYDEIAPLKTYKKDGRLAEKIPELRERSEKRVSEDRDFQILKDDIDRIKKRVEDNKVSLSKAVREEENTEVQARRKGIIKERIERFAQMAKDDAEKYRIYRLDLDDLKNPDLVPADPEKDNQRYMKLAEDPTSDLDESPDYPSGLDPQLRESLNILGDMLKKK